MEMDMFLESNFRAGLSEEEHEVITRELPAQNDRGLAILCCALLEFRINEALKSTFDVPRDDGVVVGLIGSDDKGGYLGFYHQCQLAYAMGIIGPKTLADLSLIGRIRNRFAHRFAPLSFSDQKISAMCLKLARYDGPKVFCIGGEPANIYVASPLELVVSSAPEEVRDEVFRDFKRQYETDPKIRFTQVFRMLDLYLFYHVHRNRESEMSSQQRPQKQKLMA